MHGGAFKRDVFCLGANIEVDFIHLHGVLNIFTMADMHYGLSNVIV